MYIVTQQGTEGFVIYSLTLIYVYSDTARHRRLCYLQFNFNIYIYIVTQQGTEGFAIYSLTLIYIYSDTARHRRLCYLQFNSYIYIVKL